MLRTGSNDPARVDRLGALAAHVVEEALASGLAWDDAIIAFGVAARAIAAKAAEQGGASLDQCLAQAERRLKAGMDKGPDVLRAYLG